MGEPGRTSGHCSAFGLGICDCRTSVPIAAAIRQGVQSEVRGQLQKKGRQLAQTLSWERTTAATLETYRELLASRKSKLTADR